MLLGNAMMHTTMLRIKYEIVNMISIHIIEKISLHSILKNTTTHTHAHVCLNYEKFVKILTLLLLQTLKFHH